ncbi:hypothetical protein IJG21_02620 [Candidatus Saccharibacteria bacterium]|nr:hypothetical protein [Candidatus Saccharibacteria bacterium]
MVGRKKKSLKLKTWQLILILIPLLFLLATFLRLDHLKMVSLRSEVLELDKEGDEEKIVEKLNELKAFTTSNIIINITEKNGLSKVSFGTGAFYLENSYLKAAAVAIKKAEETATVDDSNPNGNIYAKASAVCRPLAIKNGWTWDSSEYISCFTEELSKYPALENSNDVFLAEIPSTELFRYDFSSPVWAPTLSGFIILIILALSVVIFIRFLIWLILEISLILIKKL